MAQELVVGDPTQPIVAAVFPTIFEAESAISRLNERGYPPEQISVVTANVPRHHIHVEPDGAEDVAAGTGIGSAVGATVGVIGGSIASLVFLPVAGLGYLAAGPLLGMLAGALAGGTAGAMTGLTEPEEKGHTYENVLHEGGVLLAVQVRVGDTENVGQIFQEAGGQGVHLTGNQLDSPTLERTPA